MGQAKRKAAERQAVKDRLSTFDIPRLATAIQKLAMSASSCLGADCYTHVILAQAILSANNIQSKICVGYAGWRVGQGDGDVILHAQIPGMPPQPSGVAYHVWLEIGTKILDLTTYQLRRKARDLDLLDGGHTNVEWCPDYLYAEKKSVSSLNDVRKYNAGMYYYEQIPEVQELIMRTAPETDEYDVATAMVLYNNPDLILIGPNNIKD